MNKKEVFTIKDWGLVRIDDRLIHGQVLAGWIRSRKFTRIQIVDDQVAMDPFMVNVLRMSAPPDLDVIAESLEKSVITLQGITTPQTTMILFKKPLTALQLFDSGIKFKNLNIGGIGLGPGRKNVFKNTSLSKDEFEILKSLQIKGVSISFLSVPGEKSKDFSDLSINW